MNAIEHHVHYRHDHLHGEDCGHVAIVHDDHVDYVHDGHLHHVHGDHVDEHELPADSGGAACATDHACSSHEAEHDHGVGCGHEAVPHDGHIDYVVDGHVHRIHADHCDDHGPIATV